MSSSNVNNPVGTYPSGISKEPLQEPTPSTRQDLPPNQDAQLKAQDNDPHLTSNPVKKGSSSASQGTSAVNEGSRQVASEPSSTTDGGEKKGIGEKIKEKLGQ